MTLDEVLKNKTLIIENIDASGMLLRKLYDMGFIEGAKIKLLRKSPLNDPLEIEVLSYNITLRVQEAKAIRVSYE